MSLYLMSCRSRQLLGFLELGKTDANSVTMYWSAPLLLIVCFVKVEFFTQQNAYSYATVHNMSELQSVSNYSMISQLHFVLNYTIVDIRIFGNVLWCFICWSEY